MDFSSKYDQICRCLEKSIMENLIFCALLTFFLYHRSEKSFENALVQSFLNQS